MKLFSGSPPFGFAYDEISTPLVIVILEWRRHIDLLCYYYKTRFRLRPDKSQIATEGYSHTPENECFSARCHPNKYVEDYIPFVTLPLITKNRAHLLQAVTPFNFMEYIEKEKLSYLLSPRNEPLAREVGVYILSSFCEQ
jgi:hypothetical protein